MKAHLDQIRKILEEMETSQDAGLQEATDRDFSALELPIVIQEIVDYLQPLLSPYEAAFYWGPKGAEGDRQNRHGLNACERRRRLRPPHENWPISPDFPSSELSDGFLIIARV